ncbi:hypothetical protein BDM02DRAFT_1941948 [Thelephora ganbajun]|uniref:Uncharacterized protein n=1 Tax=Thelephora ganbajun TaxID=370292 RepID=A0ACB6ZHN1_THEGA|nr:hypothetical protein BDM02DRAFT_1941948 [Thelephora ganbajun]
MEAQPVAPLPRGKACLPCRQRRVKCDGIQPSCGRCIDKKRQCKYREQSIRDEPLEREAAALEERIRENERLRHMGMNTLGFDPSLLPQQWWQADEPPTFFARLLVTGFLSSAPILGFFLDPERFMQSFDTRECFGHSSRPSPALLSAIYVWGITLSKSPYLAAYESVFLSRALHHAATAPTSTHPNKAKHALQAELLLGNYYFYRGLVPEGRAHCNVAIRIALVYRVHTLAGVIQTSRNFDAIEQREWVNAFWMAYCMDLCWTVATSLPSVCPDLCFGDDRVNIPWPIDGTQFKKAIHIQDTGKSQSPLTCLFENPVTTFYGDEEVSFITMECKAAILLHRAHKLAMEMAANPSRATDKHTKLCRIIDDFRGTISPVVPGGKANRRLVIVHTLAVLATLRLDISPNWTKKSIEAAFYVISILDNIYPEELKPVNPMIGFLWSGVGQVLIDESSRLATASGSSLPSDENEDKIEEAINQLCYFMEECGRDCPYIAIQHKRLEARRRGIFSGSERPRPVEEAD